jgi:NADH:ubiquinone oxidoreductase subunit 6 (subunit J)
MMYCLDFEVAVLTLLVGVVIAVIVARSIIERS